MYYIYYLKGNTRHIIPNARFKEYSAALALVEHYHKNGPYVGEDLIISCVSKETPDYEMDNNLNDKLNAVSKLISQKAKWHKLNLLEKDDVYIDDQFALIKQLADIIVPEKKRVDKMRGFSSPPSSPTQENLRRINKN